MKYISKYNQTYSMFMVIHAANVCKQFNQCIRTQINNSKEQQREILIVPSDKFKTRFTFDAKIRYVKIAKNILSQNKIIYINF